MTKEPYKKLGFFAKRDLQDKGPYTSTPLCTSVVSLILSGSFDKRAPSVDKRAPSVDKRAPFVDKRVLQYKGRYADTPTLYKSVVTLTMRCAAVNDDYDNTITMIIIRL